MRNIIKKILLEHNYTIFSEDISEFQFYQNIREDYFIVESYDREEFLEFFESKKTNSIITKYNKLQSKFEEIRKSTSAIILVEVDEVESFYEKYKYKIMSVEEDQYFFRKYVLIYEPNHLEEIDKNKPISEQIRNIVSNKDDLDKFSKNPFFSDIYNLSIQLLIKLPFFNLETENNEFQDLNQLINDNMQEKILDNQIITFTNKFPGEKEAINSYFEELEKDLLAEKSSDNIEEFFKVFEVKDL